MDKYFNDISVAFALVGGFVCNFLGGWDLLLKSIVTLKEVLIQLREEGDE